MPRILNKNVLLMTLFFSLSNIFSQFAGGNGTAEEPYQISNVAQLQEMNSYLSSHFTLINNIDASETDAWNGGMGFVPIGNDSLRFTGRINGQLNVISGLHIYRTAESNVGLFGCTDSTAVLYELFIESSQINGDSNVGALAGTNYGNIENCYTTGFVTGVENTGGFAGINYGNIKTSYSNTFTHGLGISGGFIADNRGHIENSYSYMNDIYGNYLQTGGFTGINNSRIYHCYSANLVTGYGFCAVNNDSLYGCYWDTDESQTFEGVGVNNGYSDVTGLTKSEMNYWGNYTDWDFIDPNIWSTGPYDNYLYPWLYWQPFGIAGVPSNIKINIVGSTVTISWDRIYNAEGYKVYSANYNNPYGTFTMVGDITSRSITTWTGTITIPKNYYYVTSYNSNLYKK